MKRREFVKAIPLTALVPAGLSMPLGSAMAESAPAGEAPAGKAPAGKAPAPASGGGSGTGEAPRWSEHFVTTDMDVTGPDGKPNGQTATFSGTSKVGATADSASSKMKLTAEEQAILDGKDGEEKAKLMKILVQFGETFGATKLVDLGGAPHSNLYIGAPYLESLIDMLNACADAGLKSYAPYTVNPRPCDVYNVQNNPKDMELIYQGYPLQMKLDYVHSKLGAPDLNYRSYACYLDEVGNAPEPGTPVAWCESSAVNYGNMHKLKAMGSATAAAGAVGCYHVEGVTPEPKEKGREMLVKDFQTYVYDDKEQQAIIDTFENLWSEKDGDPTGAFIGCPHNTYQEVVKWGKMVTEALDKAGQEKTAIPVYMFMPNVVRTRLLEEEGELASKMRRAGMFYTNMCAVSYSGVKGFSDRVRGVTNSAKTRNYSSIRYFPDQKLLDIMVTGKV